MLLTSTPSYLVLYLDLTSVFQKDRRGMREVEGLASVDRGYK